MKRQLPPLKSLVVLESVVRTGGVTSASDELLVTHGAVSKQLALIEDWIGRPLFTERRRGMVPTPEALRLAEAARVAFDGLEAAVREMRPQSQEPVPLRVVAPASMAMRWLIPQLPRFAVPGIPVDVTVRPTHTGEEWLSIPFDVAIRRGEATPAHFRAMPLFREELGLVVSAETAPRDGSRQDWLKTARLVEASTRPGELAAWFAGAGHEPPPADRVSRYPHFYVALEAMLSGGSGLVAPLFLLSDLLRRGDIVEPWPKRRIAGAAYTMLLNPAAERSDVSQAFVEWLAGVTTKS
jgi:DNA-binding transcriptional LysR family regulator